MISATAFIAGFQSPLTTSLGKDAAANAPSGIVIVQGGASAICASTALRSMGESSTCSGTDWPISLLKSAQNSSGVLPSGGGSKRLSPSTCASAAALPRTTPSAGGSITVRE